MIGCTKMLNLTDIGDNGKNRTCALAGDGQSRKYLPAYRGAGSAKRRRFDAKRMGTQFWCTRALE